MTARRDPLAVAAIALACIAFAGSFAHVQEVVAANGQDGWLSWAIAAMPEAMVLLSVLKVRRAKGTTEPTAWAWVVGGSAAVFTIAANLATATPTTWGYVAAGWPAWAAICAAGLVDLHPTPRPATAADQEPFTGHAAESTGPAVRRSRAATKTTRPARSGPARTELDHPQVRTVDRTSADPCEVQTVQQTAVPVLAQQPRSAPAVDLEVLARDVAADLERAGQRLTRRSLLEGIRDRGASCGTDRASELLRALHTTTGHAKSGHARSGQARSGQARSDTRTDDAQGMDQQGLPAPGQGSTPTHREQPTGPDADSSAAAA